MAYKMRGNPFKRNFSEVMKEGKSKLWEKSGVRPDPDYEGGDTFEKSGTVRRGQQELGVGPFKNVETKQDKTRVKDPVKPEVEKSKTITSDLKTKGKSGTKLERGGLRELKAAELSKPRGTAGKEFDKAFATARKAGKKEFTWKGKKYHTRTKEEEAGKSPVNKRKKPPTSIKQKDHTQPWVWLATQ